MSFPNDGRNHHNAVKSEKSLYIYKNQIEKIYNKNISKFKHLGGTKNKTDVIIYFEDGTFKNISLKEKKKGLDTGSFDYVNTSSFDKSIFDKSFQIYNTYKNTKKSKYSKILKECCSIDLDNISDEVITKFFINNVVKKYEKIDLLIIDGKNKKIYKIVPLVFDYVKKGGILTILKNDKITQSKKVLAKSLNNSIDLFNLRIRFHLNNGNSKWLGLNNGSSNLVIKFQQDKVKSLI
jgi:hypothetical protein